MKANSLRLRTELDIVPRVLIAGCGYLGRAVSGLLFAYGVVVIFFFQAEDGIRDRDVTGVQTCALPILARLHTQGVDEAGRRDRGGRGGGGEVELDPRTPAHGAEQAAARMKRGRRVSGEMPVLPQHVRGRERGVATQVHLDRGSEPAEPVAVAVGAEEGRLGEVHLAGDRLHPGGVARLGEHAHGGGVTAEAAVGERVDLNDPESHRPLSYSLPQAVR